MKYILNILLVMAIGAALTFTLAHTLTIQLDDMPLEMQAEVLKNE